MQTGDNSRLLLFPPSHLYPANIADPNRPTTMISTMHYNDTTVPDTSRWLVGTKVGGRFGLFRVFRNNNPEQGFQLNLDIGINAQFDQGQSTDNIGWNGIYSLIGQYRFNQQWSTKFGLSHISSHLGDEYIEREGAKRIDYTRREVQLGVNWGFTRNWQAYAETGYGYGEFTRNWQSFTQTGNVYEPDNWVLQESWRVQTGLQFQSDKNLWFNKLGWYAALDFGATEERDFSIDTTFQAGLVYYSDVARWRIGLEIYDGRTQIGELFLNDEQYTALAVWIDFF